jgi:hypothetical protein
MNKIFVTAKRSIQISHYDFDVIRYTKEVKPETTIKEIFDWAQNCFGCDYLFSALEFSVEKSKQENKDGDENSIF